MIEILSKFKIVLQKYMKFSNYTQTDKISLQKIIGGEATIL
jgi:hypothetical protein